VGSALLGKRIGDMISVQVPAGTLFLTVAAIE
jgi:transcription elongation GreA/GreB family factor